MKDTSDPAASAEPAVEQHEQHDGKGPVISKVIVGSEALAAPKLLEPVKLFSKRMLQLYMFLGIMFLTSTAHGYDGSLMGTILVTKSYRDTFQTGVVGEKSALITAMYQIGGVSALPFMGPLTDQWGRRVGTMFGTGIIIIGTILEGTSAATANLPQFMAGRFFLGFGVFLTAAAAPTYVVEMSHPAYRGVMTGTYNCMYYTGAILAAGITRGSKDYSGNLPWLIPTWMQMAFPAIVFILILFFPESPRWLYTHGQQDKAKEILVKYHGNDNPDSLYVALQLREFADALELDGTDKRFWDYSVFWRSRGNVRRILCNVLLSVFAQWSQGGISYYIAGFYKSAGITEETTVLDLNLGLFVLSGALAITGASMADTWGRRKVIVGTQGLLSLCWAGITAGTATYAANHTRASSIVGIFFYWLFQSIFSFGLTPLQALYPVEVLSYEMRAKGMAINSMANSASALVNQFGTANALQNIGWKTYLVFTCWTAFQTVFSYFFFVETKGYTLEELDEIFAARHPNKEATRRREVVVPVGE